VEVVTRTVSKAFAIRCLAVPIGVEDGQLKVAMVDPLNREVLEDIQKVQKLKLSPQSQFRLKNRLRNRLNLSNQLNLCVRQDHRVRKLLRLMRPGNTSHLVRDSLITRPRIRQGVISTARKLKTNLRNPGIF